MSIDRTLLIKLRVIAAQRSTTVSRMLADELAAIVDRAEEYERARRHALDLLETGFPLGWTGGDREGTHEPRSGD